jgi:3',5'-cyclic AMP phosphodiesterase CpdA
MRPAVWDSREEIRGRHGSSLTMRPRRTVPAVLPLLVVLTLWVGTLARAVGADAASFRFAVMADSRSDGNDPAVNSKVLRQLISDMNALNPAFCLFPGDLVFGDMVGNDAFRRQLQEWVAATSDFKGTIYVTPGNHDIKHVPGRDDIWREVFPNMPGNGPSGVQYKCSYYFDYDNSRFVSILSDWEDGRRAVDQDWLARTLSSSSKFKHIFVMSHHPMQDLGDVGGAFWKSLVKHHVNAYFCGHWHEYNRFRPGGRDTWQVIVGTAGAPLIPSFAGEPGTTIAGRYGFAIVDVTDASVKVTFYSDSHGDGHYRNVIDSFFISGSEHGERRVPGSVPVAPQGSTSGEAGSLVSGDRESVTAP